MMLQELHAMLERKRRINRNDHGRGRMGRKKGEFWFAMGMEKVDGES